MDKKESNNSKKSEEKTDKKFSEDPEKNQTFKAIERLTRGEATREDIESLRGKINSNMSK